MAEEDDELGGDAQENDAPAEAGGKGRFSKKMMIIAPLLLVLIGGGVWFAASYLGLFDGVGDVAVGDDMPPPPKPAYYHELPEMVVNLSSKETRSHFLKMKIALEVSDESVARAMQPNLPRVLDLFQVYLRELRAQDLEGSQGIYRLKEELLKRINIAVHPSRVNRILFKEIIVQ